MASTPEIVQCLIDHGARLVARLVDGRTALHIAAARGNKEMVKALMDRSLANEEEEDEKLEARRAARRSERKVSGHAKDDDDMSDAESEASEITLDSQESDSMTMGSFVKVEKEKQNQDVSCHCTNVPFSITAKSSACLPSSHTQDGVPEDSTDDPDIYEVDVIAWDYGLSPLHLAILNGHLGIIDLLVSEYGADVLLPVKQVLLARNFKTCNANLD
jgi:ankyrin repeat protein